MGTVFTKPIVINAPNKDIVFDGCDFTGDAYVTITAAASVSFLNCRFYKCTPYQTKSYLINGASVPAKIVVENNTVYGVRQGMQLVSMTSSKYKKVTVKNNHCYAPKKKNAIMLSKKAAKKIVSKNNKMYKR